MPLLIIFVLSLCLGLSFHSQAEVKKNKKLMIKLAITTSGLELETKPPPDLNGKSLKYKPNSAQRSVISFDYDWLGFSVGAKNPVSSQSDRMYGETKATDYQFRLFWDRWSIDLFYQKYKGYFIENSGDVIPGWDDSQPRRLYPDLALDHVGASVTLILDPAVYSMSAATNQSERQTKSGGSWLLNVSSSQHSFSNDQPLTPTELASGYGDYATVKSARLMHFNFGGGYGYNLVFFEKFFASGLLIVDLGLHQISYETSKGPQSTSSLGPNAHVKLALGLNSEDWIFGTSLAIDTANYLIERTENTFGTTDLSVFVGTRF